MSDVLLSRRVAERFPQACPSCLRILLFVAETAPVLPHLDQLAQQLGYRGRNDLNRHLVGHGFPPVKRLVDWMRFLSWLGSWERSRLSLMRQAWGAGIDTTVCLRTVRRVTGNRWRDARTLGLSFWLDRFVELTGSGVKCGSRAQPTSAGVASWK